MLLKLNLGFKNACTMWGIKYSLIWICTFALLYHSKWIYQQTQNRSNK